MLNDPNLVASRWENAPPPTPSLLHLRPPPATFWPIFCGHIHSPHLSGCKTVQLFFVSWIIRDGSPHVFAFDECFWLLLKVLAETAAPSRAQIWSSRVCPGAVMRPAACFHLWWRAGAVRTTAPSALSNHCLPGIWCSTGFQHTSNHNFSIVNTAVKIILET